MQVFDSSGRPRLDAGSSFKDYIGLLALPSWRGRAQHGGK
jgi:hypothetical protein